MPIELDVGSIQLEFIEATNRQMAAPLITGAASRKHIVFCSIDAGSLADSLSADRSPVADSNGRLPWPSE